MYILGLLHDKPVKRINKLIPTVTKYNLQRAPAESEPL